MGYLNFVCFPLGRLEGDTAEADVLEIDRFLFSSPDSVQLKNRTVAVAL